MSQGTSYSTPYVTGIAAAMLGADKTQTPEKIMRRIKCWATRDVIATPGQGTPSVFAHFDDEKERQECPN